MDARRGRAGGLHAGRSPCADNGPHRLSRSQQRRAHDIDDDLHGGTGRARRAGPAPVVLRRPFSLAAFSGASCRGSVASLRDVAGFAQDEWRFHSRTSLVASLRGDFYSVTSEATPGYDVSSIVAGAKPPVIRLRCPTRTVPPIRGRHAGDIGLIGNTGEQ